METKGRELLRKEILEAQSNFGVIYQAIVHISPVDVPNFHERVQPKHTIEFFKDYGARLAREALGLSDDTKLTPEESELYLGYTNIIRFLEESPVPRKEDHPFHNTPFCPTVRKPYEIRTDLETLSHFREEFEGLEQKIDVFGVMTGGFMDSELVSEYLKTLSKDMNLVLLYCPTRKYLKEEIQIFDTEKKRMRRGTTALVVDDSIQTADTIEKVATYLAGEDYKYIFVFSPQTSDVTNGNFSTIKSLPEDELISRKDIMVKSPKLLKFRQL